MKKEASNNFIKKSNLVHNFKYDYSMIEYKNAKTKIKIICPEHGIFEQTPDNHIRNHGCPKCNGGVSNNTDFFIKKVKLKHNNKYDYSLVNYKNNHTNVKIICPEHGIFEQKPKEHLKYGCEKCGNDTISKKKILTTDEFIDKAKIIHNERFDYSLVKYNGHRNNVKIICPEHGIFEQRVNSHLNGSGCPYCKQSKGEQKIKEFLNKNKIKFIQQKKFKDCKNIRPLPFDFYLPSINYCIEYDGIQHFQKTYNRNLEKIQFNDTIKNKYCSGKNGKPNLLRITYKDYNNINDILQTFFNGFL